MNNNLFRKLLLLIAFAIGLTFLLLRLGNITGYIGFFVKTIQPFLVGCFTAFLINIPMRWIEKLLFGHTAPDSEHHRLERGVSLLITLAITSAVLISIFKLIIPALADTVAKIVASVPDAINQLNLWLLDHGFDTTRLQEKLAEELPSVENLSLENLTTLAGDYITRILSTTTDIVSLVISGATNLIIAFCFSIYLLFSKEILGRQLKKLLYAFLPEPVCDRLVAIGQLCVETFCDFFSGQFVEACIFGAMFFVTMNLIRLPYAVLISVVIAILAMIPVFGCFLGCGIGVLLIVMVNPMQAIVFFITFVILQQLEDNLIYPHVVGNRVGLPSIWVLVAVTVGGGLMGLLGMLLFIPAFSVAYRIVRDHTLDRLESRQITPEKWETPANSSPLRIQRILAGLAGKCRGLFRRLGFRRG